MEAKANKMLDEANAMAELNQTAENADIDNLAAKSMMPVQAMLKLTTSLQH